jgi:hypothetical protein
MLVVTGHDEEVQWFDFVVDYFAEVTRIEWDTGTMFALLPAETANFLLAHRYARELTAAEVDQYTAPFIESSPPVRAKKKETIDD